MNLRVDLILESEQRSGSIVSVKSIMRIASIVLPAILFILFVCAFLGTMKAKNKLNKYQLEMDIAGPKQEAAIKLRNQLINNLDIFKELEGWQASRIDWHEQLIGLQREVPVKMQLENLGVNQVLQLVDNKTPARVFTMTLKGKAVGNAAEQNIQYFHDRMASSPAFAPLMQKVKVLGSRDNRKGAEKTDRIFTIDCLYHPRKFE